MAGVALIQRKHAVPMVQPAGTTSPVPSTGIVREWNDDQGLGIIDSEDTPGGCWVHFSNIVTDGFRTFAPGDHVAFTHEAVPQDGFHYRAISVWLPGVKPGTLPRVRRQDGPSAAYHSELTIRWPDRTVTEGIPDQERGQ